MKYLKYIICVLAICFELKSQTNLVPNYSFEDTLPSPMCFYQVGIDKAKYWERPSGSPDYVNICANSFNQYPANSTLPQTCYGYQYPKTGNAMVGIGTYIVYTVNDSINYFTEYISVKLTDTLEAGICYYGEFYAVLADICEYNTNRLGMYLTQNTFTTSIGSFTNSIECQVQFDTTQYFTDTLNWVKISGSFTAQGGETYLTIGSFKDGTHVKKIGSTSGFNTLCNISGDTHHAAYFYIDDVSLYECNTIGVKELLNERHFKVYPNPAAEQLNIELDLNGSEKGVIYVYNIVGELVISEKIASGKTAVNTASLNNGTYLYKIFINGNVVQTNKLIIMK